MRVLIIDNYDSFTFNLYQYIGEILLSISDSLFVKPELKVVRNNKITLSEIEKYDPTHIILSPGPGTPEVSDYFGICKDIILHLGQTIPVLGVCLGMQGIAHCFGGQIVRAPLPVHGKTSKISHSGKGIFQGLAQHLEVMRYHSLMVEHINLPDCIEVTASVWSENHTAEKTGDYIIMGIKHREYLLEGIQFHPESFATEGSRELLGNFLSQKTT